jgi:hypothetical protein
VDPEQVAGTDGAPVGVLRLVPYRLSVRRRGVRISELNDQQATAFGHAFLRWLTDEDPAAVARLFPNLDVHTVDDAEAGSLGRAVLEDVLAERFVEEGQR